MTNTKARLAKLEADLGEIPESAIEALADRAIEDVRGMLADGLSRAEIVTRLGDEEIVGLIFTFLVEEAR